MRRNEKTRQELEAEIAYFRRQLASTRSKDRQARAITAIRNRERQLARVGLREPGKEG